MRTTFGDALGAWADSVKQEQERRAALTAQQAEICQDDYEWATMTGAYEQDRQYIYSKTPDGRIVAERFA